MSAETLRRASELMRERAEAVIENNETLDGWTPGEPDPNGNTPTVVQIGDEAGEFIAAGMTDEEASHIASWHPAVALAVADWLSNFAAHLEAGDYGPDEEDQAVAVARAYLQESA